MSLMQHHSKAKVFLQLLFQAICQGAVGEGISLVSATPCKLKGCSDEVLKRKSLPQPWISWFLLFFSQLPPNINSREWYFPKGCRKAMNKCSLAVCNAKWYFPKRPFSSSTGTQLIAPVFYNKANLLIRREALRPTGVSVPVGHNWVEEGGQPNCSAVPRKGPIQFHIIAACRIWTTECQKSSFTF